MDHGSISSAHTNFILDPLLTPGQVAFRYEVHAQAFIGDEFFEEKHLDGTIPRIWV
jgi:hypothetical protein